MIFVAVVAVVEIILLLSIIVCVHSIIIISDKANMGYVYVSVRVDTEVVYGWMRYIDMVAIRNNRRSHDEFIDIIQSSGELHYRIGIISEINQIKSTHRIILGNLY